MTKEFKCSHAEQDPNETYIVADDAETALKKYLGIGDDDVIKYFSTADGDVKIEDHDGTGGGNYARAFGADDEEVAEAVLYTGPGTKTTADEVD